MPWGFVAAIGEAAGSAYAAANAVAKSEQAQAHMNQMTANMLFGQYAQQQKQVSALLSKAGKQTLITVGLASDLPYFGDEKCLYKSNDDGKLRTWDPFWHCYVLYPPAKPEPPIEQPAPTPPAAGKRKFLLD